MVLLVPYVQLYSVLSVFCSVIFVFCIQFAGFSPVLVVSAFRFNLFLGVLIWFDH